MQSALADPGALTLTDSGAVLLLMLPSLTVDISRFPGPVEFS